jgi:uncharacterized protein (TIGR02246 family)
VTAKRTGLSLFLVVTMALVANDNSPAAARTRMTAAEGAIRALLDMQSTAWNRGDVEGFMAGYWNSEKTTFAGSNGVLRGWHALRERYRRSYPDRAAMGTLTFSELEITTLGPDAAVVLGRWQLERASGPVGGVFSLVLRKLPEGWRIVHDHTSTVEIAAIKPAA